ncbi:MAG: MerR family transcriptional regulator [Chitinophagia bacterium]
MAKHLHQLDLFGMERDQPVHIKAPVEKKKPALPKFERIASEEAISQIHKELAEEELLPTVSRTPMSLTHHHSSSKRGRKSFASMDADIHTLNIPASEELIKKLYYPIGEVASWFNVNTSLIRYWEKEFKQLQPRKTRKGDRLFRAQDIEFLRQLYFLLREKKYSIEGAKTYLKNNKEKAEKDIAVLNSLKNIKQFLLSLKESL